MEKEYDCIIIGGGIIGCMTARWLSRYRLKTLLIEKLPDIGAVTTAANSAIIHPGYDPLPGTLKASLNVSGNRMWDDLAGELNFEYDRCGDYVVAVGPDEQPALDRLLEQGRRNGVPGIGIINGEEMRKREPMINPDVSGALWRQPAGSATPSWLP